MVKELWRMAALQGGGNFSQGQIIDSVKTIWSNTSYVGHVRTRVKSAFISYHVTLERVQYII